MGGPPAWELIIHRKLAFHKMLHRASDMTVFREEGNKPPSSIKGREILD